MIVDVDVDDDSLLGWYDFFLSIFTLLEHECETTFATIATIFMVGHEHTSAAFFGWTFTTQTTDLAIVLDLVEHGPNV
jgi:hypothetical protein